MRITDIQIPEGALMDWGLKAIEMRDLDRVVILAGRNGSGKSRLLQVVSSSSRFFHREDSEFKFSPGDGPIFVNLKLKGDGLQDPFGFTQDEIRQKSERLTNPNLPHAFESIHVHVLSTIQRVQDERWEATHPESTLTQERKQAAQENYEHLNDLIFSLLGDRLARVNGGAGLFGERIGLRNLSEGQKILLQFAVAIHAQGHGPSFKSAIFLLDEPENHLHPSVMLEVIEAFRNRLTEGQLWIATHSIPLLAHFSPSCIWWMHEGTVKYGGTVPEKVLESLLGDEERIHKTADFLNLPAALANIRYAHQSLSTPIAVDTDITDPQTKQIREVLRNLNLPSLRLLDFGAGKGRLISYFASLDTVGDLRELLSYVAYEPDLKNAEACISAIGRVYDDADRRCFKTENDLNSHFNPGAFDVIILCNVLHEIPADDWIEFLGRGSILKLLKDTGFLLHVEDMNIPIGEKPHQKGFLVLDTPEIKTLFGITETDSEFCFASARQERLKSHKIPKAALARINGASRKAAVQEVSQKAKREIIRLRSGGDTYQNGRLHGFWLQQFANAELALASWG